MAQYIDKDALVAEIERRKQVAFGWMEIAPNDAIEAEFELCDDILSFINTLEVKEVDLEKEYKDFIKNDNGRSMFETAKHFFELGLKVNKSLIWEDISNINDIVSEMLKECGENILYDTQESFCKEVLKRFKAQKGE